MEFPEFYTIVKQIKCSVNTAFYDYQEVDLYVESQSCSL